MIERELIEDHLANSRAFAIEWTTRPKPPRDGAITNQLSRIDLKLRQKWTKLFRENKPEGKTFSKCIRDCTAMADTMWSQDLSKEMGGKGTSKGEGEQAVGRFAKATARQRPERSDRRSPKRGGRSSNGGGDRGNRSSNGGGGRGSGGSAGKQISLGSPMKVKNGEMAKTARSRGDKKFCSYFSKGTCKNGDACKFAHVCSVMVADNRVCEAKHSAMEHTVKVQGS